VETAPAPTLAVIAPVAGQSAAPVVGDTPDAKPSPVAPLSSHGAAGLQRSDAPHSAIASVANDTPPEPALGLGNAPRSTSSAVRVEGPVIGPEMSALPSVVDAGIVAAPNQSPVAGSAASPRARTYVSRPSFPAEKPGMFERTEGGPSLAVAQTVPSAPANRIVPAPTDRSDPLKRRADDRAIMDGSVEDATGVTNAGLTDGSVLAIPTAPVSDPGSPPALPLPVVSVPRPVGVEAAPPLRLSLPEAPLPRGVAAPDASPVTASPPIAQPAKTPSLAPAPARGAQILAKALRPDIDQPSSRGRTSGPRPVPDQTQDVGYRNAVLPSTLAAQVVPAIPVLESGPVVIAGPVALADRGGADDAARPVRGAQPEPLRYAQSEMAAPPEVPGDAAVPASFARASMGGVAADSVMPPGSGPAEPVQPAEAAEAVAPTGVAEPAAVSAASVRVDAAMASAGTVQALWNGPAPVAPVVVSQQAEGSNDTRASRSIAPARDSSSTASRPLAAPSDPVGARRPDGPLEAGDPTAPDMRAQDADAARMAKPKTKGVVLADAGSDHIAKIQPEGFVAPQASDPVAAASAPSRATAPPLVARQAVADLPVVVAQPGRIGQDMGVAIVHRLAAGEQERVVRLEPAALGRIEVRMAFDDQGGLRAVIAADNPVALDMLRRDSADLARALNDAGIRNDGQSLRFQTDGNGGGNAGGQSRNPWLSGDRATDRSTADRGVADDPLPYRQVRLGGRYDLMA
jgi:hypothetical protein